MNLANKQVGLKEVFLKVNLKCGFTQGENCFNLLLTSAGLKINDLNQSSFEKPNIDSSNPWINFPSVVSCIFKVENSKISLRHDSMF